MVVSVMPDSDSEFGYDFSLEEEELMLQLDQDNHTTTIQDTSITTASSTTTTTTTTTFGLALDSKRSNASIVTQNGYSHQIASYLADATSSTRHSLVTEDSLSVDDLDELASDSDLRSLSPPLSVIKDVQYPNLSQALLDLESTSQVTALVENERLHSPEDERSPLQRFRSFPKKPLTVSDLTSGAWCELQYWYTLTRLPGGRRTRTAAMRQGTKIHQKLEDEVHTTVKIDIVSKEDGFGLRLWNLVQGLRTLRDTGLTRELEVWGFVEGNLVNGVIDGVSYENPDAEFEKELSGQGPQADNRQATLGDYFPPQNPTSSSSSSAQAAPKIYLTDVKTRGSTAPVSKPALRPAKIQLLLYHRFLSQMAAGHLSLLNVFRRYGLDPDVRFSDSFLAQIGELHDEVFFDTPTSSKELLAAQQSQASGSTQPNSRDTAPASSTSSASPDLLKYGSLRELIPLIEDEIDRAFPLGAASLGHILQVQYIHREDGRELDSHTFPVSRQLLDSYLSKYMDWWRGDRKASGVDIEESFKCRTCEFADICSWRQGMDDERVRKANQKVLNKRAAAAAAAIRR